MKKRLIDYRNVKIKSIYDFLYRNKEGGNSRFEDSDSTAFVRWQFSTFSGEVVDQRKTQDAISEN